MPRLEYSLLHRAYRLHPLLPRLLRSTRDLESARNELRWLREHAIAHDTTDLTHENTTVNRWQRRLRKSCLERERGKPLQYILGSQPFGNLEILCRPGVLIPRTETESITAYLASLIRRNLKQNQSPPPLRILDLCSGTGCISLLLHQLLAGTKGNTTICGVDISVPAIALARDNLRHNVRLGHLKARAEHQVVYLQDNIFDDSDKSWLQSSWDVIVSNPPYISPKAFDNTTSRSVRKYEPKLALVPTLNEKSGRGPVGDNIVGDMFYLRLLHIAKKVNACAILMEVADMEQAVRVVKMVIENLHWRGCEIWRDWPSSGACSALDILGRNVDVRGEGNGRAVLVWSKGGTGLVT